MSAYSKVGGIDIAKNFFRRLSIAFILLCLRQYPTLHLLSIIEVYDKEKEKQTKPQSRQTFTGIDYPRLDPTRSVLGPVFVLQTRFK